MSVILGLLLACGERGSFQIQAPGDRPPDEQPPDFSVDGDALQAALDAAAERNAGRGGVTLTMDAGGWPVFVGAAGDRAYNGGPMVPGLAYEVASVTKVFTSALVLSLVRDGQLGLDEAIGPLLGSSMPQGLLEVDGVDRGPTITVRQLLQHTSGLPDYWTDPPFVVRRINAFLADFVRDGQRRWTAAEILAYAADLDPIGRPGEGWHYSDTNYLLLGLIIERTLGKPYHEALRARVLRPLDLRQTWMVWEESAPDGVVLSARYEGARDLTRFPHQSADWVGGGLASTSADLVGLVRGLGAGQVIGAELSRELLRPVATGVDGVGYGLGVFVIDLGDRGRAWGHDGYGGAFVYTMMDEPMVFAGTVNQTESSAEPVQGAAVRAWRER